jgi:hypothetical protein
VIQNLQKELFRCFVNIQIRADSRPIFLLCALASLREASWSASFQEGSEPGKIVSFGNCRAKRVRRRLSKKGLGKMRDSPRVFLEDFEVLGSVSGRKNFSRELETQKHRVFQAQMHGRPERPWKSWKRECGKGRVTDWLVQLAAEFA